VRVRRVFVIGNISLDLILGGIPDFPEWGVEVLVPGYVMRPGGAGSNAALALSALGVETFIVGTIGKDEVGEEIKQAFQTRGVRTDFLFEEAEWQTGLSVALTHAVSKERSFFTELGAQSALSLTHLKRVYPFLEEDDGVLLCGYFLSPGIRNRETALFLQELKREKGGTLLLDTGWPTEGWTQEVKEEIKRLLAPFDYFLPNEKEIAGLLGEAEKIFSFWSGLLVVKLGSVGCCLYTPSSSFLQSTIPVTVQDTIGAGDYFNAGFLWALQEGYEIKEALFFANLVASLNIASSPQRDRLVGKDGIREYVRSRR